VEYPNGQGGRAETLELFEISLGFLSELGMSCEILIEHVDVNVDHSSHHRFYR